MPAQGSGVYPIYIDYLESSTLPNDEKERQRIVEQTSLMDIDDGWMFIAIVETKTSQCTKSGTEAIGYPQVTM
jgi:hypothetical protein